MRKRSAGRRGMDANTLKLLEEAMTLLFLAFLAWLFLR